MKKGLLLKEKNNVLRNQKIATFVMVRYQSYSSFQREKKIKSNPCHKLLPPLVKISLWFAEFNHAKNAYFN